MNLLAQDDVSLVGELFFYWQSEAVERAVKLGVFVTMLELEEADFVLIQGLIQIFFHEERERLDDVVPRSG